MNEETVPDLYRLAFIPGCFKCPQCGFALVKQSINTELVSIGTSENDRTSEECPNCPGVMLVHVTYRERLAEYDAELTRRIDSNRPLGVFLLELLAALEKEIPPFVWHHTVNRMGYGNEAWGFEERLAICMHLPQGIHPLWLTEMDFSKTIPALMAEITEAIKNLPENAQLFPYG